MSEYYKIIEKIECISTRRYSFTARHIVSAASSETGIAGALPHPVLFVCAKMAADTNRLKELRVFLRAGNENSAKRLIQT